MSPVTQAGLAFASVGVLLALMAGVRQLASAWDLNAEVQRKFVHVGTGLYALCLPWLFPDRWPVYMLLAVTMIVMVLLRTRWLSEGLGRALHDVERRSYGDFLLALAVGLCLFLSNGDALLYVLPIAVLTFADAAAALAGTSYGTRRFRVEDGEKSVEGTAVFFVLTFLIAILCLMFLSDLPPARMAVLALMVAAFGTLVEAQSWRGFDNLFLPLGLLVFLSVHGASDIAELTRLVVIFLIALIGFIVVGRKIGLSAHASRVYVVAMFLVLSVTDAQNAILPASALLAHAWASMANPSEDAHGALDIVAALALISFGWLALGEATGWNAVAFYGISTMGLAMGLVVVALRGKLMPALACAGLLFVVRHALVQMNLPEATWAEPLVGLSLGTLALCTVAPLVHLSAFQASRVMKLTVLAAALPVVWYAVMVVARASGSVEAGIRP